MCKIGHHGQSCSYFYKADEKHLTVAPPQNNKKGNLCVFCILTVGWLKKKKASRLFHWHRQKNLTRQRKSNIVMNKYLRLCPSPAERVINAQPLIGLYFLMSSSDISLQHVPCALFIGSAAAHVS